MRPKGMKENPFYDYKVYGSGYERGKACYDAYEAGANAYEEGLKKKWLERSTDDSYKEFLIPVNRKGYLVFLEE